MLDRPDGSPLAVVDLPDGVVAELPECPAGAVVVGVLGAEPPDVALLEQLDVALAPAGSAAAAVPGVVGVADPEQEVAAIRATAGLAPIATWSLARVLRTTAMLPVEDGVVFESATYSSLLGGEEFRRWRSARPWRLDRADGDDERVSVSRDGDLLAVRLTRPRSRNAYDARMRDALLEALAVAEFDPALTVVLEGEGVDFCAGGDLDEFGSATDLALAHRIRATAHPGLAIHRLGERVTVRLHGNCIGSGIEIAAFAARVVGAPDTRMALPELSMGLIPGAGGTVSLTRRIGRHRVLWWALSERRIDAEHALSWGLLDDVDA